ncbi:alpha/beta hydrolase [Paeniglutamicibacter sp. R2-26]|uniref:alpha/beta hydrolase n=1 Tax=Paeniglutamicibacter sp. R2-26 TaxID=3144417 RepID=UPI003EE50924
MNTETLCPVPFAPEIQPVVDAMAQAEPMTLQTVLAMRGGMANAFPAPDAVIGDRAVESIEGIIPGPAGAPDLEITILRPRGLDLSTPVPGLYNIHGGGMVVGHRNWETGRLVDLVERLGVVAVNVEYRLAPENPYPAGAEDCYAGFVWMSENAAELGVDPERIVVMGGSAGGAFSAAVALMARDRRGPAMAGQLLLCPMVDNTNTTVSSHQYRSLGTWTREANELAWPLVLGEDLAFSADAPAYAAPARAKDLSGLPPAFIEVGSAELFRDEDVEFASRIWAVGGEAELHVFSGGCHGFDMYAPQSELTRAALATRESWLCRVLDLPLPATRDV